MPVSNNQLLLSDVHHLIALKSSLLRPLSFCKSYDLIMKLHFLLLLPQLFFADLAHPIILHLLLMSLICTDNITVIAPHLPLEKAIVVNDFEWLAENLQQQLLLEHLLACQILYNLIENGQIIVP